MTDNTQPRREMLKNVGKGAAIISGGLVASSTTAAADRNPVLEVNDVPGDYELVDAPRKWKGPIPYRAGFTIEYSLPSEASPLDIVTAVEGSKANKKTREWTISGSGEITAWGRWGYSGVDEIWIRLPNTGWRRDVFGP